MDRHVEYCRRPDYRAKKREYDRRLRAREYATFADAHMLLVDIEREVRSRITDYDIRVQNGTYRGGDTMSKSRVIDKLSATSLKEILWETLDESKTDKMLPAQGDAIASQAREILRTIKVQLQIVGQSKRNFPTDVIDFAEKSE